MSNSHQHYFIIDGFFDAYSLPDASHLLRQILKTADRNKAWKGPCPADVACFTGRLQQLVDAAFSITGMYDYRKEVILDEVTELWTLTHYDTYCGWHRSSTPWDFFPRHLSQAEFKDPYKALKKFTRYRSHHQWQHVLKELAHYALSPVSIHEFDDGTSMIGTWLQLHKLLEAAHLIEVRRMDDEKLPRKKWKAKQPIEKEKEAKQDDAGSWQTKLE